MNQEVYNKCRKKARRIYKKTKCKKKDLWNHVKNVKEIAKYFCRNTDLKKKEKRVICLGCILHDIGRTKKARKWYAKKHNIKKRDISKPHNIVGAEYLEDRFFKGISIKKKDKKIIVSMVKNHSGKLRVKKGNKNKIKCFAVSLVRFADKFANKKIMMIDDNVYTKE